MTVLVAKRKLTESWRAAVEARARTAAPALLDRCLAAFDRSCALGEDEATAAHAALAASGLLWEVEEPGLVMTIPQGSR